MLIIEGIDNTGKDTLIEGIRRHEAYRDMPSIAIHNGAPPKVPLKEIPLTMLEAFKVAYTAGREFPGYALINRGHISGAVYDDRYRGVQFPSQLFWLAEQQLDPDRDVILYLRATPTEILKRDDGKSTYSCLNQEDALHAIAVEDAMFTKAVIMSNLPSYVIDVSRSPEETLSQALTVLAKHEWGG